MITVIGTSHISPESVKKTREVILKRKPECVAVELCPERLVALKSGRKKPSLKFGLSGYILAVLQEHLSHKTHIMPGAEMLSAVDTGLEVGSKVALIDMPIRTTMGKIARISGWKKTKMVFKLLIDSLKGGKMKIDLNTVPDQEVIDEAMWYMKKDMPEFYDILVKQRNKHMYNWIKKISEDFKDIIVVVGAGHKKDLEEMITRDKL
ncbi:MAG: hypothetical protein GOV02_01980 [Candidatus Aenigmarchaeota archaeon]|nr:hypothetical protein [Candidatus Aenigmarchaeota archaeon]